MEEEPDEILDRLEDAPSKSRLISKLSPKQVHGCFTLAIEYGQLSRQQAIKELEDDLAVCFSLLLFSLHPSCAYEFLMRTKEIFSSS